MDKFADFGLLHSLVKTLKDLKIQKPTDVQKNTIPMMMSGQSVVGVAETGSGKTLAYALPVLNILKSLEDNGEPVTAEGSPRAIVMVPTRELGEQVSKVFKTLTHETRLRVRPALGGMAMEQARRNTSGVFEILLATPGRLTQLMDLDSINLTDVRMLIFDEADQMIDQGFLPDSNKIYYACPNNVQLALFSATVSPAVQDLINTLFAEAEVYRSAGSGKVVKSLTTQNLIVKDGKRWPVLEKILKEQVEGGTILFANTREQCDKIAQELADHGYEAVIYRGEMDKNERRTNLRKFAQGKVKLLVATDLAGRGLDIQNIDRVINYHLPKQKENYLHRAGRTARAGRKGVVINLVTERDERLLADIEGRKKPEVRDPAKYSTRPVDLIKSAALKQNGLKKNERKQTSYKQDGLKQTAPKKSATKENGLSKSGEKQNASKHHGRTQTEFKQTSGKKNSARQTEFSQTLTKSDKKLGGKMQMKTSAKKNQYQNEGPKKGKGSEKFQALGKSFGPKKASPFKKKK